MVEEQITKLNKRVLKLGLPPIVLSWNKPTLDDQGQMMFPCDLTGPLSVSYDGWEFVATLQHLPTGENILRTISNEWNLPEDYRTSGSACQHCEYKRYRKDTYVVYHQGDDHFCQVGSTCIKDFLGGNSPDNIMQRAGFVADLLSFMDGACHSAKKEWDEGIWHIVTCLAQTAACIRDYGWLSKGDASKNGGTATATWVQDNLQCPAGFQFSKVDEADKVLAKLAAEWAENISDQESDGNDYLHNIRAIARSGMVGYRTIGYAASILVAYERFMRDTAPRQTSNHLGSINDKLTLDLNLIQVNGFESRFGYTNKYIFQDQVGNILVWLTSTEQDLEKGKKYKIKGTVKNHSEFKGTKQTELSRCSVVSRS